MVEAPRRARIAERARIEAAERDELFGFTPAPEDAPAPDAPAESLDAAIDAALAAAEPDEAADAPAPTSSPRTCCGAHRAASGAQEAHPHRPDAPWTPEQVRGDGRAARQAPLQSAPYTPS